jgi:hypothetical protein
MMIFVRHERSTIVCQARTIDELHIRVRPRLEYHALFELEHERHQLRELSNNITVRVVNHLRGGSEPTKVFVQTEDNEILVCR